MLSNVSRKIAICVNMWPFSTQGGNMRQMKKHSLVTLKKNKYHCLSKYNVGDTILKSKKIYIDCKIDSQQCSLQSLNSVYPNFLWCTMLNIITVSVIINGSNLDLWCYINTLVDALVDINK